MPSPLIVSAEPECHLYFARRVTFLSCADMSEICDGRETKDVD
jgi:hypothetical protein